MSGQEWFDDFTRAMASRLPRRQALKLILVGAASQLLPKSAWAGDEVVCKPQKCPKKTGDRKCEDYNVDLCSKLNPIRIIKCEYSGRNCKPGFYCDQVPVLPDVCPLETPICITKGKPKIACVQCTDNDHCRRDPQKYGKRHCCKNVCCEKCSKCDQGECRPQCPQKPWETECCTKPWKSGEEFTDCCGQGCCNRVNGKCIKPEGKILQVSASQLEIEIQETQVGLGSILLYEAVNATVEIPRFEEGTTGPVYVTATRMDPMQPATVQLTVSPRKADQCSQTITPTLTQLQVSNEGSQATRTFERIPWQEHFVTIQNGEPGLRRVQVLVNGEPAAERWLLRGTVAVLDVFDRMTDGENAVTVVADGPAGGSALVFVGPEPNAAGAGDRDIPETLHPILWEPATWRSRQDLTWGR
jgi:hypothetical protein